jgi:uncharacterized membrane protein (UPF0127 family)
MNQLMVEVFKTPLARATGLMDRDRVPSGTGALFLFDVADIHSFWGKNTLVDLDIIFVTPEWVIDSIKTVQANDLTGVRPDSLCIAAIETAHEWCRQVGVSPGMTVSWDGDDLISFEEQKTIGQG